MNRAEYIVVIDSEPTVREVVSQILVHAGYEVAARADFGSALDLIRSRQPDLVITNVFLRDGTGHDAILRLKQEFPGICLMIASGLPQSNEIAEWLDDPEVELFPKPFTAKALTRKVEQVLLGHASKAARGRSASGPLPG